MKNKKFYLKVAVALACLSTPITILANDAGVLDKVYVEGIQTIREGGYVHTDSRLGLLGNKSVMDVPFTQVSFTEKAISDYGSPAQPLQQVLINEPSVRVASSSPMYSDFSVRGIGMNGTHMYFNNVPSLFSQFRTPPNHMIERIDFMVGPGSALNGTAASSNGTNSGKSAAPGVINVQSKRAGETAKQNLTMTFTGKENIGTFVDVGDRVGKNKEWGLRAYAGWLDGELALKESGKTEKTIGLNIDHRGANHNTNFFIGHIDLRVDGAQRWFNSKAATIAKVPDNSMEYDFPETTKWAHWYVSTLNHEQKLNKDWTAFFNGGTATWSGSKYNMNASLEFDKDGKFINNYSNLMNEKAQNRYYQVGLKGSLMTGVVKHDLVFAYDQSDMTYYSKNFYGAKNLVEGNLYDGIILKPGFYPLPTGGDRDWKYDETNKSITVNDFMSMGKWKVLLGATHRKGKLVSTSENINNSNTLPTFGITYHPSEKVSIYAGHSQSLSRGQMVTAAKYENKGEVLDPVKQKQTEVGIKYDSGHWLTSLAYFAIDQGNFIDEVKNGKTYLSQDGMNDYKGLALSVQGQVSPKLTLTGGLLYMDAERKATSGGKTDGWFVYGTPDFSATLGANYQVSKSVDLLARVSYNGSSYVNDNKGKLLAYTLVDVGANWNTHIGTQPVKVHAMVYNLFDKNAWMGRAGSTTFGLTWPRTYTIRASIDF